MRPSTLRITPLFLYFVLAVATSHRVLDTDLAADQVVGTLFDRLFPEFPEKTPYFHKTSPHGDIPVMNDVMVPEELVEDRHVPEGKKNNAVWYAHKEQRKRGPGCMRKCIAQGILHPVQCHSLC
ncbi:uncharacterized protein LOC143227052 [Tachypleus tridentatus]|uniref:uncharacterized protein LOC143227052 n=1 Tax=Tachypleus tridentatus TaxID=6853 RepID=UPI003FD3E08D